MDCLANATVPDWIGLTFLAIYVIMWGFVFVEGYKFWQATR